MGTIEKIIREINTRNHFLLTTHIHPDGDALGSILALHFLLDSLGKRSVLFTEDPVPNQYLFLPGVEKITHELKSISNIEACIVVDCGDSDRIGPEAGRIMEIHPTIVIDHHLGRHAFGDIRWVNPESSAAGELVYNLIKATGVKINYEMAINLYAAILTDTGSFRYASTTSQALRIAAEMVDTGVDPAWVSELIYETYPANRLRLLCAVLSTLRLYYEGGVAIILASQEMFRSTCTSVEDAEGLVNYPRAVAGVQLAVMIKEVEKNCFSVSLRSRNNINAAYIAEKFGGGGHFNAAGFKRCGDYEVIREELLAETGLIMEKKAVGF